MQTSLEPQIFGPSAPSTAQYQYHHPNAVSWLKRCYFVKLRRYFCNIYLEYFCFVLFSGLFSGKWSQQLCSQWPNFDLLWLLPRPLWRRVSVTLLYRKLVCLKGVFIKINLSVMDTTCITSGLKRHSLRQTRFQKTELKDVIFTSPI